MPFKSQAQRRKFAELLVKGEISPDTFEEWNRETGSKKLPERVKPKGAAKRKRAVKRKRAAKRGRTNPRKRR
jgi:macrodomain Ter protein organizer (MatP/YcbG family)